MINLLLITQSSVCEDLRSHLSSADGRRLILAFKKRLKWDHKDISVS